jgi:hypothetical protein
MSGVSKAIVKRTPFTPPRMRITGFTSASGVLILAIFDISLTYTSREVVDTPIAELMPDAWEIVN